MKNWICRVALLAALIGGPLGAQEARVRVVNEVATPTPVDSNSPAFWRDGRLFWFTSRGGPSLSEGASQFGPWDTRTVDLQSDLACPKWMEAVSAAEDGTIFGWYHAEPVGLFEDSQMTVPEIGAAVSFDGGRTFQDLGIVLESGDISDPTAQNGYFAGGHGDFSVILNQEHTYYYFLFGNYGGSAESQGVVVARMAFEDRFNPSGNVWKYYNGEWTEPGRGGRVTPIFPVKRAWQARDPNAFWGPSIHWNTYLNSYVMLLNHAQGEPGFSQEGVYVSFSADLSHPETWAQPSKILGKSDFPGWYFFYPQVMGLGLGGTDTLAGQTARLYVGGVSKWEIDFSGPLPLPSSPLDIQPESDDPTLGVVPETPIVWVPVSL